MDIKEAAAALGRRGGQSKSLAKQAASRANGKLAWRKKEAAPGVPENVKAKHTPVLVVPRG